jgi:hypothetical protein
MGRFTLNITPKNQKGIRSIESKRTPEGTWKNEACEGVPVYVSLISRNREELKALREQLLGKEAADKADKADRKADEQQKRFEKMSETEMQQFSSEMALKQLEHLKADMSAHAGEIPEELKGMFGVFANLQKTLEQKAKDMQAGLPDASPELKKLMAEMHLEVLDEDVADDEDDEDSEDLCFVTAR